MKNIEVVLNLSWVLLFTVFVQAQLPESLNIACGATANYTDYNGLSYVTDDSFIESGEGVNGSLRTFPSYTRNCYRINSIEDKKYLIRADFRYGNYDGNNYPPQFDLYIGTDYWTTVNLDDSYHSITTELITVATSDLLFLCLVNTGHGIPIISTIRLIALTNELYGDISSSGSLVLVERWNAGSVKNIRYPDDRYDRIWNGWKDIAKYWANSTESSVSNDDDKYEVPLSVLQTESFDKEDILYWEWTSPFKRREQYRILLYFAELLDEPSTEINISCNESSILDTVQTEYLKLTTVDTTLAMEGNAFSISIDGTNVNGSYSFINAMEAHIVTKFNESTTHKQDVEAIMGLKEVYQVKKNWIGDPCLPEGFPWSGLTCNNDDPPRIKALNLSNSGLIGAISDYLVYMSSIENIDLSNNYLTGSIPEFLAQLTSLKVINLSNNKLSVYIPGSLQERIRNGLQMRMDNNWVDSNPAPASTTDENHPKKKFLLIILAAIIVVFILLAALVIFCIYKRNKGRKSLPLQERKTTYPEVVKPRSMNKKYSYKEVLKITNNLENIIGKGGYGTVFSGHLNDGKKVAVKVLSQSSAQGFKEFSTEINLLMNIYHKNLVSFVGYCHEDTKMVLIHEYMDGGNLRNFLSSDSNVKLNACSWEQRVRIALDAAQGLDYLHHGCQPPIIHRDIKTTNILLNERLEAKIADFGLSKTYPVDDLSHISTGVMGTPGYIDPEYYMLSQLNEKSDVYSFGVVLLELLTGELPLIKASERIHIVQRVNTILQNGEVREVIDSRLEGEWDIHSVQKFIEIAFECTSPTSAKRPSMSHVVTDLKECLKQETQKYTRRFESETQSNIPSIQYLDTQALAR